MRLGLLVPWDKLRYAAPLVILGTLLTSSVLLILQSVGGAIFVSAAEAAFENKVIERLPSEARGAYSGEVLAVSTTGLRLTFMLQQLPEILDAFPWTNSEETAQAR